MVKQWPGRGWSHIGTILCACGKLLEQVNSTHETWVRFTTSQHCVTSVTRGNNSFEASTPPPRKPLIITHHCLSIRSKSRLGGFNGDLWTLQRCRAVKYEALKQLTVFQTCMRVKVKNIPKILTILCLQIASPPASAPTQSRTVLLHLHPHLLLMT